MIIKNIIYQSSLDIRINRAVFTKNSVILNAYVIIFYIYNQQIRARTVYEILENTIKNILFQRKFKKNSFKT